MLPLEDPEVTLIEGQMHMIEAEEVKNLDFLGLNSRSALRSIGSCQAARRLADHVTPV